MSLAGLCHPGEAHSRLVVSLSDIFKIASSVHFAGCIGLACLHNLRTVKHANLVLLACAGSGSSGVS